MLKAMLLSAMLMVSGAQALAATPYDQLFLRHEAEGGAYELALARLAQTRAARAEVRTYAATLVNDHETYNTALRDLAKSKGVALTTGMSARNRTQLDRLSGLHGNAFDAAFLREARRVNAEDVRSLRKAASRTTDAEIRALVSRSLEVDEKHEAGARALSSRNQASRMPAIQPPMTGSAMPVIPPAADGVMPVISPPGSARR